MRVHFLAAVGVLVAGVILGVTRFELLALMLAVSFVLITEMINTAIEKAIDVATNSFDPVARVAKDVSAGAVLIAAVNAALIGYLVFADRLRAAQPARDQLGAQLVGARDGDRSDGRDPAGDRAEGRDQPQHGTPLRGGLPSGHAAVAYGGWVAVTFATSDSPHVVLVSTLTFLMATLVAQTRVESGVHTTGEVVLGGLLGATVTTMIFRLFA